MASSRRVEIDLTQLAAKNIVTPNDPRSRVADEFRVLKRPLLGNAKEKRAASVANGNLIMVTSSLPGEGKTFTAINLAMSIFHNAGKLEGAQNVSYFISDGEPNQPSYGPGLDATDEAAWINFLHDNRINSLALGTGGADWRPCRYRLVTGFAITPMSARFTAAIRSSRVSAGIVPRRMQCPALTFGAKPSRCRLSS